MKLAIFAARKTHLKYAQVLSSFLRDKNKIDLLVLWHRKLGFNIFGFNLNTKACKKELKVIVDDYYRTKANEPESINKTTITPPLSLFKTIEANILFRVYSIAFSKKKITHLLIWNGLKFRQRIAVSAAKQLNIQCYFIERGAFPGTTTLDEHGINFINSVPREASFYETYEKRVPSPQLVEHIARPDKLPENYIFIPFQVNTDSQIVLFSPWIKDMFSLIDYLKSAVQTENDIPTIIFKPHPSCPQDYSKIESELQSITDKIKFVRDISTPTLIKYADAVATINSSVGMEAILMRKKVIVMGQAFYNIEGISLCAESPQSLTLKLMEVKNWQPNKELTNNFLNYLKYEYVVDGSWHKPNNQHLNSISEKLIKFINIK